MGLHGGNSNHWQIQSPILKVGHLCWTGTVDIFVISQLKWLKFGLQAHLFKMFGHAKFQLSISCTFIVMKHLVEITKYTTKTFITLKVQEIESWNFACPNILKRCAWRPNFSHFGWEMTKISTVPVQHNCPTFSIVVCTIGFFLNTQLQLGFFNWSFQFGVLIRFRNIFTALKLDIFSE